MSLAEANTWGKNVYFVCLKWVFLKKNILEKKKFKKLLRNFFFFYYWKKKFYKMSWGANYCTAIFVCGGNFFEKCFPIFYFTTSIHLKSGLIRGIAFCGSGLIREVASLERDNLVIHFSILLSPFIWNLAW